MMGSWILLVFVVLVSGFLSYWGDVVGRKLGKKRLTLGRLRPRHTAALMTAFFGMFGSALAIAALILVSEPVRAMLFEGDKVRSDLTRLQQEQKLLRGDLAQRLGELNNTKKEVNKQSELLKKEKGKLDLAQKDVASLTKLAKSLQQQASQVRSQLGVVRKQLATLGPEYEKLKGEYSRTRSAQQFAYEDNQKLQKNNFELGQEIKKKEAEAKERITLLQGDITNLNRDLASLRAEYDRQAKENVSNIEALKSEIEKAKVQLRDAQTDLSLAQFEAKKLNTVTRTQPLILSRDDELARIKVRNRLNLNESKTFILALIEQASGYAKGIGAQATSAGGSEAVLPAFENKQGQLVSESEQIQALSQTISGNDREQVIIASSLYNSFQGEPVGLRIRVFPNPVVYKQGQTISEGRFDGQGTQDQVLSAITQFLQEVLAPKAVRDGLIPARGRPQPLGEIGQEEILKLVAEIRSRPFVSKVRFVAAQETRASDRLKMEFRFP